MKPTKALITAITALDAAQSLYDACMAQQRKACLDAGIDLSDFTLDCTDAQNAEAEQICSAIIATYPPDVWERVRQAESEVIEIGRALASKGCGRFGYKPAYLSVVFDAAQECQFVNGKSVRQEVISLVRSLAGA